MTASKKDTFLAGWAVSLVFVAAVLAFSTRHDAAGTASPGLVGRTFVIDGDTIDIHGVRIRLNGIDAPESRQTCEQNGTVYRCGQRAAFALSDFLGARVVACEQTGTDRYHRVLATCRVDGVDIGEWMVSQGWAIAYRKYSAAYIVTEEKAHAEKRGIWAGTFIAPEQWRRLQDGR